MTLSAELRGAFHVTALLGAVLSLFMLLPSANALLGDAPGAAAFAVSALICGLVSLMIGLATRGPLPKLTPRFGFLLVNLIWWTGVAISAVPLVLGPGRLGLVDALFEAASGLTTTGSTVLAGLDAMDHATLLWRALMQWIGGLGILSLGLILLPFLSVGGMQLFRVESSDKSDKAMPRFVAMGKAILGVYVILSGLCTIAFLFLGMTPFDAVTHMMTTVSTGGFSTHDASFGHFDSLPILAAATLFMVTGSLPLTFFVALFSQRRRFRPDPQVRVFLLLILGATAIAFAIRSATEGPSFVAFVSALFNMTSIITTTGFAAGDYTSWGAAMVPLIYVITFFGGCAGSTAGGLKTYRIMVMFELLRISVAQLVQPRGVFVMRYGGRTVAPEIFRAAMVMVMAMIGSVAVFSVALGASGLDFTTALSGAVTALTNVGPGLGPIIGPAGTFAPLPDAAKLILAAAMVIGRLEILAVLVLASPAFWRN